MKSSLLFFSCFTAGILLGRIDHFPDGIINGNFELYLLYFLIFLVGINIGGDTNILKKIIKVDLKYLLVPFLIIIGTFVGIGLTSVLVKDISLMDALAVGAGFGYYSLSSVLITQLSGETLGVLALLTNIIREVGTILFTPILVKIFGKISPIASGGATAMDTTLPVIQKYSGSKYAVIALISGIILSILVPVIVPLFIV